MSKTSTVAPATLTKVGPPEHTHLVTAKALRLICLMREFPFEEVEHQPRYLPPLSSSAEMARIEQVEFGFGKVAW